MTTAHTQPKRRRSREETRQRLLDAALGVFARNGFERATVDEIVRDAGFSKGAFYVHFDSKEDLFWETLKRRIEAQQVTLSQAIEPGLDVVEAERRILRTLFEAREREPLGPAVYYEFVAHAMRKEKVRERLAEFYASWHEFVVQTLKVGRESGAVRDDVDLQLQASALMATFEGALIQSQLASPELRLSNDVDAFARLLADWLIRR
jgi:TetR/AcrR family fatty acid metabolism transcriptional regulator